MAISPLNLALFDCDGTLVDSQYAIVAAIEAAWRSEGLAPPTAGQVRRVVGLALEQSVAVLAARSSPTKRARLVQAYREAFFAQRHAFADTSPLFPGALAALDALDRRGILLGVATGKSRRGLDVVLEHHGLSGRFATLQTPDCAPGKPDPGMVLLAGAATGIDPANIAVIGDTVYDIRMARAAGAGAIGVTWGYHEADELNAAGADCLVAGFAEVPAAVASLVGRGQDEALALTA